MTTAILDRLTWRQHGLFGLLALFVAFTFVTSTSHAAAPEKRTIVLVGAKTQEMPEGQHDWSDGVLKIQRLINLTPALAGLDPTIRVYPAGFPANLSELDNASTIVFYFGAVHGQNPVEQPAIKAKLEQLMAGGTGLVALHQSFTLEDGVAVPFDQWLGGYRKARKDYTVETAPLTVVPGHPISRGLKNFSYLDEFYPTVEFAAPPHATIATAKVHVQGREGRPVFEEPSRDHIVAWAHERPSGGRSFGYSGAHFLDAFDQPQVQVMILNAIMWTAGLEVPSDGAISQESKLWRVVLPTAEVEVLPQTWGELRWFASRELGNSDTMTVGQAIVRPNQANPPHWHPNCDEILYVAQGHIMHRVGDREYEMKAGDTVVIPEGTVHNARNIGKEDAILMVSFNSADRVAIGE